MLFSILCCLAAQLVYPQNAVIQIDASQPRQSLIFGGDAKLTIVQWAQGNTEAVAQKLFGDVELKILRIPIFALHPIDHPIYDEVIKVVKAVQKVNPQIKIFASVANGDGHGKDHHGRHKFPKEWQGCCEKNVYNLNLEIYATYLDSFIERMQAAAIKIDYLGAWNEDKAFDTDYEQVYASMEHIGTIKKIGLERWGLQNAINEVAEAEHFSDINGSHFYDDKNMAPDLWLAKWKALRNTSKHSVWYTESTRYKRTDDINFLIAGLHNIFPAINAGVEAVLFYQVFDRWIQPNGEVLPLKYSGFKNFINAAKGKVLETHSSDACLQVTAFKSDKLINLHILNLSPEEQLVDLEFINENVNMGKLKATTWSTTDLGTQQFITSEKEEYRHTLKANSYTHFQIIKK